MRFRKLLVGFILSLPVCMAARIFQIVYATEYSTGFSIRGREWVGLLVIFLVAAVCIVLAGLSFKTYKNPEKPPKVKIGLAVSAIIVVSGLLRELIFENMSRTMPAWQVLAVKFVTVVCVVYFVAFAVQAFTEFKMPAILHAVPCVYAIVKTISTFVNISSLALIYDNVLLISGYSLLMLFFISYGKLYNGLDKEKGFRRLMATGFASATVCITQASVLLVDFFGKEQYPHSDIGVMWTLFGIGLFIISFLCEYFYKVETEEEHI